MKTKKIKNNIYFDETTEQAILKYNTITNITEKNLVFDKYIYPALLRLSEYSINSMHAYNLLYNESIMSLQNEIMVDVMDKLYRFDESKGKAFSYFTIVIRNYIITKSKKQYNKKINEIDLDYFNSDDFCDYNSYTLDELPNQETFRFVSQFVKIVKENTDIIFPSDSEKNICINIIDLFFNNKLQNINKREVYKYIKNENQVDSKKITDVIEKLKYIYIKCNKQFIKTGILNTELILKSYKEMPINNPEIFNFI